MWDGPSLHECPCGRLPGALFADGDGGGGSGDEGSACGEGENVKGGEAAAEGGSPAVASPLPSPKVCVVCVVCVRCVVCVLCMCVFVSCMSCCLLWSLSCRIRNGNEMSADSLTRALLRVK